MSVTFIQCLGVGVGVMEGVEACGEVPSRLQRLVNGQAPLDGEDIDGDPTPLTPAGTPQATCIRSRECGGGAWVKEGVGGKEGGSVKE